MQSLEVTSVHRDSVTNSNIKIKWKYQESSKTTPAWTGEICLLEVDPRFLSDCTEENIRSVWEVVLEVVLQFKMF